MKTHYLWIKRAVLPFLRDGNKDLEVRVRDRRCAQIGAGDIVVFRCGSEDCTRVIEGIRCYTSFEAMLRSEAPCRIMPGWTKSQLLNALRNIYPRNREALGVLVFTLKTAPPLTKGNDDEQR